MEEVKLVGVHEQMCKKLKAHVGQKICQYSEGERREFTLISIDDTISDQYILLYTKEFGVYTYLYSNSSPLVLCIEEDKALESFEEMIRRKQEEIFRRNL